MLDWLQIWSLIAQANYVSFARACIFRYTVWLSQKMAVVHRTGGGPPVILSTQMMTSQWNAWMDPVNILLSMLLNMSGGKGIIITPRITKYLFPMNHPMAHFFFAF